MAHVVHLSSLAGSPLLDSAGTRLGRVEDVVARLDLGYGLPLVGRPARRRIGGRDLFVPICADRIARARRGAGRHDEAEPGPVRASPRRGPAARGRARTFDDQRHERSAGRRPRGRARPPGRQLARRGRRSEPRGALARLLPRGLRGEERTRRVRRLDRPRAVRGPRSDFAPAPGTPAPGSSAPGADRRPRRGRIP